MKRKLISVLFLLALCLCISLTAYATVEETFLYDKANLLTDEEEAALHSALQTVSQAYDAKVVIVTDNNTAGGDIDYYVEQLYDTMGLGYGPDKDGVLLLICMDVREFRILSNGFAAQAITLSDIDSISDYIVSDLSSGYYYDAFASFAEECDYYLNGYVNGFPFDGKTALITAVIIGLVVGLIVALVLKGQLKSVHKQSGAHGYIKSGSMKLTTQRDLFLYRDLRRVKKETNKSSGSSSGSSRNVGGRSF